MALDGTFRLGYDLSELDAGGRAAALKVRAHAAAMAKEQAHAAAEVREKFKEIGSHMAGVFGVPLGISGGLMATEKMFEHAESIVKTGKQLDETPENVQRLGRMAAGADSDLETLAGGMFKLRTALMDVTDPKKQQGFKSIGLDTAELIKLPVHEQVLKWAEAMQKADGSATAQAAAVALVSKSAKELLPVLREDVEELRHFAEGPVISDDQIRRIAEMGDRLKLNSMSLGAGVATGAQSGVDKTVAVWQGIKGVFSGRGFEDSKNEWIKAQEQLAEANKKLDDAKRDSRRKADAERIEQLKKWRDEDRADQLRRAQMEADMSGEGAVAKVLALEQERKTVLEEIEANEKRIGEDADYEQRKKLEVLNLDKQIGEARNAARKSAEGVATTEGEIKAQELRSRGQTRQAENLERQIKQQKDFQRFRDEHPEMGEDWALQQARRLSALDERAKHPGRVHGVEFTPQAAFAGLDWLHANRAETGGLNMRRQWNFGGLDALHAMQQRHAPAHEQARNGEHFDLARRTNELLANILHTLSN